MDAQEQVFKEIVDSFVKTTGSDQKGFMEFLSPYVTNLHVETEYNALLPILQKLNLNGIESLAQFYIGFENSILSNFPLDAGLKTYKDFEDRFGQDRETMTPLSFQQKIARSVTFEDTIALTSEMEKPLKDFLSKLIEQLEKVWVNISKEEETILLSFMTIIEKVWLRYRLTRPGLDKNSPAMRKQLLLNNFIGMNMFYSKEKIPQKMIDYIETIYVPEPIDEFLMENKTQVTLSSPVNAVVISVPLFHQKEDIFEAVKKYFHTTQHINLIALLQGKEITEKLLFLGQANQLADIFRKLLDYKLITGCLQKELIVWVIEHFEHKGLKGQSNALKEKHLSNVISGKKTPCKNPLIEIEYDETTKKMIFTSSHKEN